MSSGKVLQLTRSVYFNRSGVLLLSAALLATLITVWAINSEDGQQQVLLAISTGLYASTMYAFLETGLTALRYEAVLGEAIAEAVDAALARVVELNLGQQREFLPTHVYTASQSPDHGFNRDLNLDLLQSDRYIFRGVTGRYAIARLLTEKATVDSAEILVANPVDRRGMEPRVTHIVSYTQPDSTFLDVQDRLIDEIYETVVGARLASGKCRRLDVHVVNDPQVDRVELFDSSLYLTLYSETKDRGAVFPKTVRFSSESTLYRIYSAQLARSCDTAAFSFRMQPNTSDEELCEILRRLGKDDCELETVRSYENSFRTFADAFRTDIN